MAKWHFPDGLTLPTFHANLIPLYLIADYIDPANNMKIVSQSR